MCIYICILHCNTLYAYYHKIKHLKIPKSLTVSCLILYIHICIILYICVYNYDQLSLYGSLHGLLFSWPRWLPLLRHRSPNQEPGLLLQWRWLSNVASSGSSARNHGENVEKNMGKYRKIIGKYGKIH